MQAGISCGVPIRPVDGRHEAGIIIQVVQIELNNHCYHK